MDEQANITRTELALATRNHGMPLEALSRDITPLGLHYLLIHYDIPFVDVASWSLEIGGSVDRPISLDFDALRSLPAVTMPVTLECAGNGRALLQQRPLSQPWLHEAVGTAAWTGTPLAGVLDRAGLTGDTVEFVFTGLDRGVEGGKTQHYERSLTVAEARRDDVLIAYEINGQPLPPQHGYPARLVVPGWYGMASVKWLSRITAVTTPFEGHQQAQAYRWRDHGEDPGVALNRIAVRSLLAPPGTAAFPARHRHVPRSGWQLVGRAWSGAAPIERVEVSDDGGNSWYQATVDPAPGRYAWHRWSHSWTPGASGELELWCRATDAAGNTQPLEPVHNVGGYAVNAVHRTTVIVEQ